MNYGQSGEHLLTVVIEARPEMATYACSIPCERRTARSTGGRWRERETISRMSAVITRTEQAARSERVEYRGRLVDPRYRFRTSTIIEALGITETEMRACGFRHLVSSDIRREHHRVGKIQRRRNQACLREEYEAKSTSNLKPWEAKGISRRTWYRQRGTSLSRCMVAKPQPLNLFSEGTVARATT